MNTQNNPESGTEPITLDEFMNSMQRLFKIGIYYPTGHAILDKATDRFMGQLEALAGDNPSITLQDSEKNLKLEGVKLNAHLPFVREFRQILSALGIAEITIDRQISVPDLHVFVRKMLHYKSKILQTKKFTLLEVSEMPHSVTIKLKEFLARKDGSISDERSGEASENIEIFLQSLSKFGLNEKEINRCTRLLESLPEQLNENNSDSSKLPYASWDDIARLFAQAVRERPSPDTADNLNTSSNINALASILKRLEADTSDPKSRETINLLASVIKKTASDTTSSPPEAGEAESRIFPAKPSLSIKQLQSITSKYRLHPKVLSKIPGSSNSNEMLSILLQLAQHKQTLQTQMRMQQLFREMLSGAIPEKTWEILSSGLQKVVSQGATPQLSLIIRQLVEILRRSRHGNSLYFFLLTIEQCNAKDSKTLWPYVVNELLVTGSSKDRSSYRSLSQFAASLSPDEMSAALPRLRGLEAFQDNTIAPDIFHAITPLCYPLFAFLLKTELEQYVGERILGGLRRHPADWLIKAIVPMLDLSKQEHKLFLLSYLRLASHKFIPASLKNVAAKIITEILPALSQDRRNELWVQHTISALSQLPTPETQTLLEQIAKAKKMVFLAEWPPECRKAAESALNTTAKRKS